MTSYLITDPDCGFCQKAGGWLERTFGGAWTNMPAHASVLEEFQLTPEQAATAVWFVKSEADGSMSRFAGSDAVAHAISARGFIWRVALVATYRPLRWVAQAAYRLIARNRHRLPGGASTCDPSVVTTAKP